MLQVLHLFDASIAARPSITCAVGGASLQARRPITEVSVEFHSLAGLQRLQAELN